MPTRADYAKIHIALKDLGLSDDDYRALLYQRYKKESSKDLTDSQVADLLRRFQANGWKPGPKKMSGVGADLCVRPDGERVRPDGERVRPDGERVRPDGERVRPNTGSYRNTPAPNPDFITIQDHDPNRKQKRYILALWNKLGWKVAGIHKRCKSQFNVDRFEWVNDPDHLQTLVKDLWNRCKAKGIDPEAV